MNWHKKTFIISFMLILTMPVILWRFFLPRLDIENVENREMQAKPDLTIDNIFSFSSDYEQWFTENFPLRLQMVKYDNLFQYRLFRRFESKRVIAGTKAWLFYTYAYDSQPIQNYKGLYQISEQDLALYRENLIDLRDALQERDIDFLLLIMPDKPQIYPEFYPSYVKRVRSEGPGDTISEYLIKNSDLKVLYPKEMLTRVKKDLPVYYMHNTHSNEIGSFVTMQEAVSMLGEKPLTLQDITFFQIDSKHSEMSKMLNLGDYFIEKNLFQLDLPAGHEFSINELSPYDREYHSNSPSGKKLAFFGDSFATYLLPNATPIYSDIFFTNRLLFSLNYIFELNPDAVIIEVCERYAQEYLKTDFINE